MDPRPVVAAVLLVGAGPLAGCSSDSHDSVATDDSGRVVRGVDPAYALAVLRHAIGGDYGVLPTTLAEALPNHRVKLKGTGHVASLSDALVIGTVTKAAEGNGVIWSEAGHPVVDYEDSRAETRTVIVTMSAEDAVGRVDPGLRSISFRVLVPYAAQPRRFVESLAGLGHIAVVLDRDPTDKDSTPWRPIIDDKLIAVVADDGSLSLPTMQGSPSFAGDIHTTDDLLDAAHGPVTTTTVGPF